MHCPNCGYELEAHETFCANCGVETGRKTDRSPTSHLCRSCGQAYTTSHQDAQSLCPACEQRIQAEQQTAAQRREREKKKFEQSARVGQRSQRRAVRFEVARCYVRVRKMGMAAMLLRRAATQAGTVVDLSAGGLQCLVAGAFAKGEPVAVQLLVPAFNNPLGLKGIVRWAVAEAGDRTRMGVEFSDVESQVSAHLAALEKHEALRSAAHLLEERRVTREIRRSDGERNASPPSDF